MSVAIPQKTGSPEERRRHIRQKARSIVSVKLDNNNGGILLNLGAGGLSFQAVAEIDRERDLILHFKLPDCTDEIQLKGSVTWMGPSCKDAGICFQDLSDNTQQRISEWIERQGAPSAAKEWKLAYGAPHSLKASESFVPQGRIEIQPVLSKPSVAAKNLNPSAIVPSAPASESALAKFKAAGPIAPTALATSSGPPIPALPMQPEKPLPAAGLIPQTPFSGAAKTSFAPRPPGPFEHSQEISGSTGASPTFLEFPSSTVSAVKNWWFRPVLVLSPAPGSLKRPKLMVAGLASCVLLLGMIVVSPDCGTYLEQIHTSVSSMLSSSPPQAIEPDPPAAGPSLESEDHAAPSPSAPADSLSTAAPASVPSNFARLASKTTWISVLRKIFPNIKNSHGYDQALAGVQVWTNQRSGYYFCTDSPYFEKLEPGSLTTQGEALQSGYRPKLGSYCN